MSQAASVPIQSSSLYVGDLDQTVSEADLFEVFNNVGAVASIRVCRDKANKTSLGYAYVNYHSTQSAADAIEALNSTSIKGKKCRVMFSQRDPSLRKSGVGNIFIKNLHKSIDNKALYDTFSDFGTIVSCKVAVDDKGVSKGYGFVHYESDENANNAIKIVNQMEIAGQQVYVGKFISRKERVATQEETTKIEPRFTNVYVKNLQESVGEKELRELFAPYGEITSLLLKRDDKGKSKGFGFINFKDFDDAKKAVEALNGKEIEGKVLYVSRAQIKSERVKELAQKFRNEATPLVAHQQPNNLYIKNLGDDIDDNRLHTEFSVYGNIISAHIMRDAKGESKGFGFVCYTTAEEASNAMSNMNGRIFGSKPISISLAQRKEDRRQLLVAQHAQNLKQGLFAHNQMTPVSPLGAPIFFQPQIQPMYSQHSPFQYPPIMQQQGRWPQPNYPYQHIPNYHQMPAGGGRRQFQRQGNGNRQRNFRNQPHQVVNEAPVVAQAPVDPLLSAEELAKNPLEFQSTYIGEKLYPLISQSHPELAGKVTGMFLDRLNYEGGIQELLNILNDANVLAEKVHEALEVLKQHSQPENGQ